MHLHKNTLLLDVNPPYPDGMTVAVDSSTEVLLKARTSQLYVELFSIDKVPGSFSEGVGLTWCICQGLLTAGYTDDS